MSTDTPTPEHVTLTDAERALGQQHSPHHWFRDDAVETIIAAREQALREEIATLRRWKAEALPVITGLQELGRTLGVRLGTSITGKAANNAAARLVSENADLRAQLAKVEALTRWAVPVGYASHDPESDRPLAAVPMIREDDLRAALGGAK